MADDNKPVKPKYRQKIGQTGRVGQRTKRTPEIEERFLQAVRIGNTRRAACAYAGIGMATYAKWCKEDPEFAEKVEQADAQAEVLHVGNITQAARNGTWTASAWWLERRRPDEWKEKKETAITGAGGAPLTIKVVYDAIQDEAESRGQLSPLPPLALPPADIGDLEDVE